MAVEYIHYWNSEASIIDPTEALALLAGWSKDGCPRSGTLDDWHGVTVVVGQNVHTIRPQQTGR